MLRNVLLPALAIAALSGCVTDYAYRDGDGGDYYYGQPRVEYRYHDPYGYYGGYGAYGAYGYPRPVYFYDRYGRLVYGYPDRYSGFGYSGWYGGYPYWRHTPRSQQPGDQQGDHDDGDGVDRDGNHRKPPWRDIGGIVRRNPDPTADDGDAYPRVRLQGDSPLAMPLPRGQRRIAPAAGEDETSPRPRRQVVPLAMPAPERRDSAPAAAPRMRGDDDRSDRSGTPMRRVIRNAKAVESAGGEE